MKSLGNSVTACRFCQHYNPEGRRSGICGKLDVPVSSSWVACSQAIHPFESFNQPIHELRPLLHEYFYEVVATNPQLEISKLQEVAR